MALSQRHTRMSWDMQLVIRKGNIVYVDFLFSSASDGLSGRARLWRPLKSGQDANSNTFEHSDCKKQTKISYKCLFSLIKKLTVVIVIFFSLISIVNRPSKLPILSGTFLAHGHRSATKPTQRQHRQWYTVTSQFTFRIRNRNLHRTRCSLQRQPKRSLIHSNRAGKRKSAVSPSPSPRKKKEKKGTNYFFL